MATASIIVICMLCAVLSDASLLGYSFRLSASLSLAHAGRIVSDLKIVKPLSRTPGPWQCSVLVKDVMPDRSRRAPPSCTEAWGDNANFNARCAWVDDALKCVPNCLHSENQEAHLCEAPFCVWDARASTCSFNPAKSKVRRAFCDREAGKFDRRMVDKHGNQPDFYDHNLKIGFGDEKTRSKVSSRALFCRDMLGDSDYEYVDRDVSPEDALLRGAVRCWRPDPSNRASYQDPIVQDAMKAELQHASTSVVRGAQLPIHPVLMSRPLQGILQVFQFHHWIVGLTNVFPRGSMSTCLDFKYKDGIVTEALDPAGCNFFKASFKPLQELHKCMMPLIKEDPYKQLWQRVAEKSRENKTIQQAVLEILENLSEDGHMQWLMKQLPKKHMDFSVLFHQWQVCENIGACNGWMDEYERTTEIIKQIEQDSWEGLDLVGVRELVQSRLVSTLATPVDSLAPALSPGTVNTITDKCFKLQVLDPRIEDVRITALVMKESLRCMPLMWDGVNIPALPQTSLWPSRWETPIVYEAKKHPICARMAAAGLVRAFSRTKYPKSWKILRLGSFSDEHCLTLTGASCINFKDCFSAYLEKFAGVVGGLCVTNPTCCCKATRSGSPVSLPKVSKRSGAKKGRWGVRRLSKKIKKPKVVKTPRKLPIKRIAMSPLPRRAMIDGYDADDEWERGAHEIPIAPPLERKMSMLWTGVKTDEEEQSGEQRDNPDGCEFQQDECADGFEEADKERCLPVPLSR